jgi:hypothetical protein
MNNSASDNDRVHNYYVTTYLTTRYNTAHLQHTQLPKNDTNNALLVLQPQFKIDTQFICLLVAAVPSGPNWTPPPLYQFYLI